MSNKDELKENQNQSTEELNVVAEPSSDQTGSQMEISGRDQEYTKSTVEKPEPVVGQKSTKWPWLITALSLAALAVVLVIKLPSNSEAVATVNGEKITKEQLYEKMLENFGEQVLDSMITEKLIDQEMAKENVKVTEEDIEKELEMIKSSFSGEDEFNSLLAQYGMTVDVLKGQLENELKVKKLLEKQVTIQDEEMKKYYEENKEQFNTPELVRASHILVDSQAEAEEILNDLKNGGDFSQLAMEKSKDELTKDNGGDLNYFARGDYPEFEDATFQLNVGELSGVVKSEDGYHIIKVTDKKEATSPSFEEVKDRIYEQMLNDEIDNIYPDWMNKIYSQADIENKLAEKQ